MATLVVCKSWLSWINSMVEGCDDSKYPRILADTKPTAHATTARGDTVMRDLRVFMGNGHCNFTIHSSYKPARRIYMYVSMYVCMYIYIYILIYIYICSCIYIYMFMYIYIFVYIYVCMYVSMSVSMYVCMYVCIYVCIYVCMYVCMYTYICM